MATSGANTIEAQTESSSKLVRTLLEVAVLVLAVVLALLIRFTIFEAALVTSGSMIPTFQINDRILIDHRASLSNKWQRGDIVIFDTPPSWDDVPDTLIKRVIALPGETVEINEGKVYVDGKILDEPYINNDSAPMGDTARLTLEPKQYFVMGDNRNNSEDSRDKGPVDNAHIRGRAVWRLTPLSKFGQIAKPSY